MATRVAMRQGSTVTYLHTDHLGTVSIATSSGGQFVARTLNMPYGSVRWMTGTMPTDYAFTGQKDTGLGLVYMHARYYASFAGRFVSADTIALNPSDPVSLNRFSFVRDNPLRYTDPTGHREMECDPGEPGCDRNGRLLPPPLPPTDHYWYVEGYGYFDQSHIGAGEDGHGPRTLLARVESAIRNGGAKVPFKTDIAFGFTYEAYYYIAGRSDATDEYVQKVALGIYMAYQLNFEVWEGRIPGAERTGTMYAVEDLPSTWLGFMVEAKHMSLEKAFSYLGPVQVPSDGPPRVVKNYWFTPLVDGTNVQWPSELTMTPIGPEAGTWTYQGDRGYFNPGIAIGGILTRLGERYGSAAGCYFCQGP